jgi:hypothetical protein
LVDGGNGFNAVPLISWLQLGGGITAAVAGATTASPAASNATKIASTTAGILPGIMFLPLSLSFYNKSIASAQSSYIGTQGKGSSCIMSIDGVHTMRVGNGSLPLTGSSPRHVP